MATNLSDRRSVLAGAGALLAAGAARAQSVTLPFGNGERPIKTYPEKRPMLVLTERPPQLETPFEVFDHGAFTPNDAFFVRYHLAGTPPRGLNAATHRVKVLGAVENPLDLSLDELRRDFPAIEIAAVNECSGNGRGFSSPRVAGGQLGEGMMGNALWRGVPVKALLDRAGVKAGAHAVEFNGADKPQLASVADFVKGLGIDHARNGEVMLAYEMNGAQLPLLNGYPLRLIVPGYYGTYWVKHLSEINVIDSVYEGFWMKPAYRVPDNDCACIEPGTTPANTRPIGRFNVRSFVTSLKNGDKLAAGRETVVRGIAFDGGQGIREVAYSLDGGQSWREAKLGQELSRYSFREFTFAVTPAKGDMDIRVRAWNRSGQSQPMEALWQPAGYMRNVVESVKVTVA